MGARAFEGSGPNRNAPMAAQDSASYRDEASARPLAGATDAHTHQSAATTVFRAYDAAAVYCLSRVLCNPSAVGAGGGGGGGGVVVFGTPQC